jgi:hypothetical protein
MMVSEGQRDGTNRITNDYQPSHHSQLTIGSLGGPTNTSH